MKLKRRANMSILRNFSDNSGFEISSKMPIVVSSSVADQVIYNKKCNLTAKFYILKAESDESVEQKLLYYNMALSNASSEELRLEVYKKRVNIYAELKMYQQCSENEEWIQNILQEPQSSMYVKRKSLTNSIFKRLEGKPHPKLSNVIASVGISNDNNLVAKSSMKAGKLIGKEEPFCGVLLESAIYRRCKKCLQCNNMNLISCLKCQLAMFCSMKCLNDAEFHHNYECEAQKIIKIPFEFGGVQVAFRSLCELLSYFENSVNEMMAFVNNCKKNPQTIFQIDKTKSLEIGKHAAMISLKHFSTTNNYDELVQNINNVLEVYPTVNELFVTDELRDFLIDFLVMQSSLDYVVHYDHHLQVPTALSINFMYNLMKHSCASNVHAVVDDGKLYYFTKYPIAKNENLTYNHILNFEDFVYDIRKLTALKCYEFDCKCIACVKQYPTLHSMKVFNMEVMRGAMIQKDEIQNLKKKDLKLILKENCKYIDLHFADNFPCQEIFMIYLCNSLILSRLISC